MMPTPKQLAALDFIKAYIAENRVSPSVQEIANAIGCKSKGTAHGIVKGLESRKLIKSTPGFARSIEVL